MNEMNGREWMVKAGTIIYYTNLVVEIESRVVRRSGTRGTDDLLYKLNPKVMMSCEKPGKNWTVDDEFFCFEWDQTVINTILHIKNWTVLMSLKYQSHLLRSSSLLGFSL